jgi:hypothetical protein
MATVDIRVISVCDSLPSTAILTGFSKRHNGCFRLYTAPLLMRHRSCMLFSLSMLSVEQRAQIVSLLVEGNGINAITRITGVAKNTVLKLLHDIGEACEGITIRMCSG